MLNREQRKFEAERISSICRVGKYTINGINVHLKDLPSIQEYRGEEFDNIVNLNKKVIKLSDLDVELTDKSVVDVVIEECRKSNNTYKVGVLNFASAVSPGGGFLSGALAQEECLCQSSTLHSQLTTSPLYELNRRDFNYGLYRDFCIISETEFIRDSEYNFLEDPQIAYVVTSAAVNKRKAKVSDDIVDNVMARRMVKIIKEFAKIECKVIILGAFGCGVFGNSSEFVIQEWINILRSYGGYFDKVIFSIYKDTEKYNIFDRYLADAFGG